MPSSFRCTSEARRAAMLAQTALPPINGIDFLEVLDGDLPSDHESRQRIVVLTLFFDHLGAAVTTGNVSISGGTRVTGIQATWVCLLSDIATPAVQPPEVSAEDWDVLLDLRDTVPSDRHPRTLVVGFDKRGDLSTYTLTLVVRRGGAARLAGYDYVFASVPFQFLADCPSDIDCAPAVAPSDTEPPATPVIDYLARDFTSIRRMMLDRLALTTPDWTERNVADLGTTLVETLAYLGDHLSYYQDAAATEAYLETAIQRASVRRHARLLDYPMHEGTNARAFVAFQLDEGADLVLEASTPLCTYLPTQRTTRIAPEDFDTIAEIQTPVVFETMHEVALSSTRNELPLHTWGETSCCLPRGATSVSVVAAPGTLVAGDLLLLEEVRGADTGETADANPRHRHVVRLDADPTLVQDALLGETILLVTWHAGDALPFTLAVAQVEDASGAVGLTVVARGNVVLADHGRTVDDEEVTPAIPSEGWPYRPRLEEPDLTYAETLNVADTSLSASDLLTRSARDAVPRITLSDGDHDWTPQRDLLASDAEARDFVVEMRNDGVAELRFGDGILGRAPAPDDTFSATYRTGSGTDGNVGFDAIAHVVTSLSGIASLRNPLPATGGVDAEPITEVKRFAPAAFRVRERAVTAEDYEEIALRHGRIRSASAAARWRGSCFVVTVTVDLDDGVVDADTRTEILAFLEPYRVMGTDVRVAGARVVPLSIVVPVGVQDGYDTASVLVSLAERFSSGRQRTGALGYFHPDNFPVGRSLTQASLLAAALDVPGVASIDAGNVRFGRLGSVDTNVAEVTCDPREVLRVASDPLFPERGTISFTPAEESA